MSSWLFNLLVAYHQTIRTYILILIINKFLYNRSEKKKEEDEEKHHDTVNFPKLWVVLTFRVVIVW